MREPDEPVKPGHDYASKLTWRSDDAIQPGARVEATDGTLGVVRDRRRAEAQPQARTQPEGQPQHRRQDADEVPAPGEAAEPAYLAVETSRGLVYVPERLVRETRGDIVYLSLPTADALAQSKPASP